MHSFVRTSNIRRKVIVAAATGLSLFTLASCEGDDSIPQRVVIATAPTMTVTPKSATLSVGGTQQLSAQVFDGDGRPITVPITWTSSEPSIVSVSSSGLVTAVGLGTGSVVASADNGARRSASISVVSAASAVSTVQVGTGVGGTLPVGLTRQLTATAFDANGNPVPADFTWTSANSNCTVNAAGVATATAVGTCTIRATANGQTAELSITTVYIVQSVDFGANVPALLPGTTTTLNPTARDGFGNVIPGVTPTLTLTSDPKNGTTLVNNVLTIPANLPAAPRGGFGVTATVTSPGGGTQTFSTGFRLLGTGNTLTNVEAPQNDTAFYYYHVTPGTTRIQYQFNPGFGNPNMDVWTPGAAVTATPNCAAAAAVAAAETCNFTASTAAPTRPVGIWRIRIVGATAFFGWTLNILREPAA